MRKLSKQILPAILAISLAVPASAATTPWLDRDTPSGSGDWENLAGLVTKVECKFSATGLTTATTPGYRCDVASGSICVNSAALQCQDTQVQYTFNDLRGRTAVTGWLNRDDPSGTGDWENPTALFKLECKYTDDNTPVTTGGAYICGTPDVRSGGIGQTAKNGGKPVRNIAVRYSY